MNLNFRKCNIEDLEILRAFAYKTYDETFRHLNTEENMDTYLEQAFDIKKLRNELSDRNSYFYLLLTDGELAGYIKLNDYQAQTDIKDPNSLEVERIYVSADFQGKGLGKKLMDKAVEVAEQLKKQYIWLGVWEKNEKGIMFYRKYGYYEAGRHSFIMGEEEQSDLIMRKDLI